MLGKQLSMFHIYTQHQNLPVKKLNFRNKILFGIISLLILAQCASPPLILDNESYYIQTIKWLNQYGFVKGLVNLHVFLGQTSGWHLLQSAFSFSFLYDRFNFFSLSCIYSIGTALPVFYLHDWLNLLMHQGKGI